MILVNRLTQHQEIVANQATLALEAPLVNEIEVQLYLDGKSPVYVCVRRPFGLCWEGQFVHLKWIARSKVHTVGDRASCCSSQRTEQHVSGPWQLVFWKAQ